MTELRKKIEEAKKTNGQNYCEIDRQLIIATAVTVEDVSTTVKLLSAANELKHDACEKAREDIWDRINGLHDKIGNANVKTAKNAGRREGEQAKTKNLGMWIAIGLTGATTLGSLTYILIQIFSGGTL